MSDNNEQANEAVELKQYYVYILIDPCDNKVFYVGMGQGRRGNQHLQDALKEQENDENTWSEKIRRILAIKKAGSEPRTHQKKLLPLSQCLLSGYMGLHS